jgi:hypothetical protein
MTDENLDKVPERARIGLAMALLKSLPRSTLDDLTKRLQERRASDAQDGENDSPPLEVQFINGSDLSPEQLREALAAGGMRPQSTRRAATMAEVLDFNRMHEPPLRVGDRVRWRPGMQQCDWPAMGEEVVVSQIISPPIRQDGDASSIIAACRFDIALAFVSANDTPGAEEAISEFVFDSRRFERAGGPVASYAPTNGYLKGVLSMPQATPEAA